MPQIMTVGYEGTSIDAFIKTLVARNVNVLADVRELPLSRKRGFSRKSLASALEDAGIKYVHFRDLGDPKPGRQAARNGEYDKFREIFGMHMAKEEAKESLSRLAEFAERNVVCMMCFEADHSNCHRSIVSDHLIDQYKMHSEHIRVLDL